MKKLFRRSQHGQPDQSVQQPPAAGSAQQQQYPQFTPQQQQQQQQYYQHPPQQQQFYQPAPQQQYYQQPLQHAQSPSSMSSQFQNLSVQPQQSPSPHHHQQQPYGQPQPQTALAPQSPSHQQRERSTSGGDMAAYLLEQGDTMVANNDFAGAATTYTLAIQKNPTDSDLLVKRAYAYRMSQPPRLNEALSDCQAASRSNPYDWKIWAQLGQVHLQNKDHHFAVEAFEKAADVGGGQVNSSTKAALEHARAMVERDTGGSSSNVQQPSIQVSQPNAGLPPESIPTPLPLEKSPSSTSNTAGLQPTTTTLPPAPSRSPAPPPQQDVRTSAPPNLLPSVNEPPPTGMPPTYAPNTTSSNPTVRGLSQQALATQLTNFETELVTQLRGALSLKAFAGVDKIDQVKLLYIGLQQNELTNREIGAPTFAHASFAKIYVSMIEFPGSTYLDIDPETLVTYDGKIPGTLSVSGYSEEYRQQQYNATPRVTVALQHQTALPDVTLDFIVKRTRSLVNAASHPRTDASLKEILGDSPLLTGTNALQTQIEALCYTLNRKEPATFALYTQAGRNVTNHVFGSADQGNGVKKFLHHIVLGYELLIRLKSETRVVSYTGLVTDEISALLFVADQFMKNVDVQTKEDIADLNSPSRFPFAALSHSKQSAALIRFAELLKWPYMDEVREYCENAFSDIMAGRFTIFDIYDWYYSLFRPGFHFRFQLMSCLRYATPKIRDLGAAPYFNSGIIVGNKSYWPRKVVLGKVLGGSRTVDQHCGWIGPCIRPTGMVDFGKAKKDGAEVEVDGGYVELTARAVTCPIPCAATADSNMQYMRPDEDESSYVAHLVTVDNWIPASGPTLAAPPGGTPRESVQLTAITLVNVAPARKATDTDWLAGRPSYRPTVHFNVGGREVKYTLFSNPFFVYANPCVGEHPLYERNVTKLSKNTYGVAGLKDAYQEPNQVLVIDALSAGEDGDEEMLARAWCAERGLSAIVRRGKGCCFACAVSMATQRLGLGFNVLICS